MRKLIALLAPIFMALTGGVFAQTVDDVIRLAQKGIGEEVMLTFVESSNSVIKLSVADLEKLKDAKVPDKVVVAMLRKNPPADAAAVPAVQPRTAPKTQPERQVVKRTDESKSSYDSPAPIDGRPATERVAEPERVIQAPPATVVYGDSPAYTYSNYYSYPAYGYSSYSYPAYTYSGYSYPAYVWPSFYVGFGLHDCWGFWPFGHGGFGHGSWGCSPHSSRGGFHGRR